MLKAIFSEVRSLIRSRTLRKHANGQKQWTMFLEKIKFSKLVKPSTPIPGTLQQKNARHLLNLKNDYHYHYRDLSDGDDPNDTL